MENEVDDILETLGTTRETIYTDMNELLNEGRSDELPMWFEACELINRERDNANPRSGTE